MRCTRNAASKAAPATAPDPGRWRALMVTQFAVFMTLLDVNIVNVALPSIERDLAVPAATAQWVVSGYALALGLALVPAGRLGDAFGRRRMFLIGLAAFVITSAMTGAAPSTGALIAARLLQGVAGGILIPQNAGLVQEYFAGAERGRAFGLIGSTVGLATATGPVVGGLILSSVPGQDAWRWVFYVNVPIGLVALVLATRLVHSSAGQGRHGLHLDAVGGLLLGAGVLSLLIPLVDVGDDGAHGVWWLWPVAVLSLTGFGLWEARTVRRGRQPLLDPRLLRTPGYVTGAAIGLVYFVGLTGVWLVLALFLQDGLGYSPLRSGLAVTPFALGVAISALVAGRLVSRFGRRLTVYGLAGAATGLAVVALVLRHATGDGVAALVAVPLLVAGLGSGMVASPNMTMTLRNVPVEMGGAAGGAVQTAQRIGAAVGTATLATLFYHVLLGTTGDYAAAVGTAVLAACGFMVAALTMAVTDLVRNRPEHRNR